MLFDMRIYEKFYNKIKWPILFWGIFLCCYTIFRKKYILKLEYGKILSLFIALCILTACLHFNENFCLNIFFIVQTCILFFVFYASYLDNNKEQREKYFNILIIAIQIISMLMTFLGLLVSILWKTIRTGEFVIGISNKRFCGLISNPNLTGLIAVIVLITADWTYYRSGFGNIFQSLISKIFPEYKQKKKCENSHYKQVILPKWFLIANVVISIFSLLLSDSNSALILIWFYIIFSLIIKLFLKLDINKKPTQIFKKLSFILCFSTVLIMSTFPIRKFTQQRFTVLVNNLSTNLIEIKEQSSEPEKVVGREDYEITSGRMKLIEQAFEVYKAHPILGIGTANIVLYGTKILEGGLIYSDLHNAYLTILVSNGILGLLVFLLFLILVLRRIIIALFLRKTGGTNREFFCKIFAFCASYVVYGFMEKAVIFEVTFSVAFFWFIAGFAIHELLELERQYFREIKNGKKVLGFFGISPFQLISCVNIAAEKTKSKNILFTSQESGITEKLKNHKFFSKVYLISRKKLRSLCSYLIKTLFFPQKAIHDQISDYNDELIFDEIYCTDCNSIMCSIYFYNKKWNPELKLHLIEDGARNYCIQLDHYKTFRKFAKILGTELYIDEFCDAVVFEPKMLHNFSHLSVKNQVKFYKNKKAESVISEIYIDKISEGEMSNNSIIYFDQPIKLGDFAHFQITESEVFDLLKKTLPEERLKVKIHPKLKQKDMDKNIVKSLVFEPYFVKNQEILDNLVLISLSSTALFSPKLIFDREPTVIFIYKLFDQYFSQQDVKDEFICYTNGSFDSAVDKLRSLYSNKNKVICVSTLKELEKILKNIEKG